MAAAEKLADGVEAILLTWHQQRDHPTFKIVAIANCGVCSTSAQSVHLLQKEGCERMEAASSKTRPTLLTQPCKFGRREGTRVRGDAFMRPLRLKKSEAVEAFNALKVFRKAAHGRYRWG